MNKKAGVGSTTISYNLSKLFNIPLYVYETSFLMENEFIKEYANLKIINSVKKKQIGVYDLGCHYKSNTKNTGRMSSLCKFADAVIIPLEMGFESLLLTIETIKDIKNFNKFNKNLQIILVLNRLDSKDKDKDFLVKKDFIQKFRHLCSEDEDLDIDFYGPEHYDEDGEKKLPSFENRSNITLTYLRNSYLLTGIPFYSYDMEKGEYFLDLYKYRETYQSNIDDIDFDKDANDPKEIYEVAKAKLGNLHEFDYRFFKYLFFLYLKNSDIEDDEKYIDVKDFVAFRRKALK